MENSGFDTLLKVVQAGGTPATIILCYVLWQLSNKMTELKASVDTFMEYVIRPDSRK